jgi:predicted TIM-barrel fold metal-dependent hydrolase
MDHFTIADPHHHLWDLSLHRYPWLVNEQDPERFSGDDSSIRQSYLVTDYLADTAGWRVDKSVHVEAGFDRGDPVAETAWLQSIADRHGYPHGIVASASLHDSRVEALLEAHCSHANVRGIRQILNWHADPHKTYTTRADYMADPAWRRGFAQLRRYGLSFDIQIYPGQMREAAGLAGDFPDVQIVLNHTGMPVDRDAEAIESWRTGMRLLARQPNVAVKISGLGMCDWHWTRDTIRPFVRETIEAFGSGRCMFASNFPVDRVYSSFEVLYSAFDSITKDFTASERRGLFHDNAVRFYRL